MGRSCDGTTCQDGLKLLSCFQPLHVSVARESRLSYVLNG